MDPRLQEAAAIAREAGNLLRSHFGEPQEIEFKGAVHLVTAMDLKSEDLILARLQASYPDYGILTEEGQGKTAEPLWVVDPLDGTNNYAHGYPCFCVSIALADRGKLILGAIYDPLRDELFSAERGGGAKMNGSPIRVSQIPSLHEALLATGFPYDKRESAENNLDHFARFALGTQGIRRGGAAALDLSYVAAGRLDGFWELKLSPWDVAAGALIVQEAGGRVTDFSDGDDILYGRETAASNGILHSTILATLQEDLKPSSSPKRL